jgi:hypothetical protein
LQRSAGEEQKEKDIFHGIDVQKMKSPSLSSRAFHSMVRLTLIVEKHRDQRRRCRIHDGWRENGSGGRVAGFITDRCRSIHGGTNPLDSTYHRRRSRCHGSHRTNGCRRCTLISFVSVIPFSGSARTVTFSMSPFSGSGGSGRSATLSDITFSGSGGSVTFSVCCG